MRGLGGGIGLVFLHFLCLLDQSNTFVLPFWMGGTIVYPLTLRWDGVRVHLILIGMPLCNSLLLLMSEIEIREVWEASYQVEYGTFLVVFWRY